VAEIKSKTKLIWFGDEVRLRILGQLEERLVAAAVHLSATAKENVSRGQLTVGTGTSKRGLEPSDPGDYPKLVSSTLRTSIQWEKSNKGKLSVRVGSNLIYAKYLELGTTRMKRRPWLSRTLSEERPTLRQIILKGKVGKSSAEKQSPVESLVNFLLRRRRRRSATEKGRRKFLSEPGRFRVTRNKGGNKRIRRITDDNPRGVRGTSSIRRFKKRRN